MNKTLCPQAKNPLRKCAWKPKKSAGEPSCASTVDFIVGQPRAAVVLVELYIKVSESVTVRLGKRDFQRKWEGERDVAGERDKGEAVKPCLTDLLQLLPFVHWLHCADWYRQVAPNENKNVMETIFTVQLMHTGRLETAHIKLPKEEYSQIEACTLFGVVSQRG